MIICAAEDTHGELNKMYADILAFEASLAVRFDYVLHVGDFGIWPDSNKVDRATRDHDGAGDFPSWFAERKQAPRPTIFIKGNHEDFEYLAKIDDNEVLPNLTYLSNGEVLELKGGIRLGGIGGCFGPSNYERKSSRLQGYARRHFTRDEIENLGKQGKIDILLLHDAPAGIEIVKPGRGDLVHRYKSTATGLAEVLKMTNPHVCFFGHHHVRMDAELAGVPCIGLNKVGFPGNLFAIEIGKPTDNFIILVEWPAQKSRPGQI
ncbi:MAG: metallophosphoesterase family protein [Oligoflexus sp.]